MASAKGNGVAFVRNILKYVGEGGGFDKLLEKVKVVSAGGGRCLVEMVVEDGHLNKGGTLHGGFTATLIDSISTFALMTHGKGAPGVSVNMNINYLKPAAKGEEILIDAQTRRAGRTLAFLDVDITKKVSGELVATGWKEVFEWPQDRRPFMHEHPVHMIKKFRRYLNPFAACPLQVNYMKSVKPMSMKSHTYKAVKCLYIIPFAPKPSFELLKHLYRK